MIDAKIYQDDLLKEARKNQIIEVREVKYAILESDGTIHVIKKDSDN